MAHKYLRNITAAAAILSLSALSATAQTVIVYQKDGETVKYNVEDVEKIVFKAAKPFDATNLLNDEYVPNDAFREWLDKNLAGGTGYYSLEQAAAYTGEINISGQVDITDIAGIEYFTSLTSLIAEDAGIGNFKVGALKSLEKLLLVNTRVSELDLTGLNALSKVFVSRNKIKSLILGANPNIRGLYCDCNQLTELDLTGCTGLEAIVCSVNQLTSLEIPECPLETLAVHTNPITELKVTHVASTLDLVNVSSCQLSELDLTGAKNLTYLEVSENPLTKAPDLSGCSKLETFRMEDISQEMGELNLKDCSKLNVLRLDRINMGKKIDLTANKKLYELSLQGCNLEEINVEGLINLGYVNVSDNNFKRLDVAKADGIYMLFANRNAYKGAQIKVWKDFNIADPESQGFYIDTNVELVYDFSE